MKKNVFAFAALAAIAIGLTGCAGTKSGQINPANLGPVLSQDNANVDVNATTPYGQLNIHRTVPTAVNTTPIVPLTTNQIASIVADPVASLLYGLRTDTASDTVEWQGLGGSITIQRSMPPNTNAPIQVIVVNSATNPVPSVVTTNAPAK